VRGWVGTARAETRTTADGLGAFTRRHGRLYSVLRIAIDDIAQLDDHEVEEAVRSAYGEFQRELACARRHPIRFWNFIPGIQTPATTAPERYMVFNRGRFRAFESWFGPGPASFPFLPAASSVGTVGPALVVHCLAAPDPGRHVENPRQTPAYRYSPRYGPVPPSFARATVTPAPDGGYRVLVAGTASVLGEETAHQNGLDAQTAETLRNMASILHASLGPLHAGGDDPLDGLDRFQSLRVHLLNGGDVHQIAPVVASRFPNAVDIEFCQAEICRRDLLIEVEGVATLTA